MTVSLCWLCYAASCACTKAAYSWTSAIALPTYQHQARICDVGSGKISSPPFSARSKRVCVTDSGEAFGTWKPQVMSVSVGAVRTAWTLTARTARRARRDWVRLNAAAFEMAYAGLIGNGAMAIIDTLLTIVPPERISIG